MAIKLVLILSVLAILIANTEAGNKEIRRGKFRGKPIWETQSKVGEQCISKKCMAGTTCRKVSVRLINLYTKKNLNSI